MSIDPVSQQGLLNGLLSQAAQRRPYLTALALISPGGQLWAAVLPAGVEPESIAAMAAPAALLGRRIALEQLEGDMRQVYVEGEGGYVILRAVGREAILLTVASGDANLALVLHDVSQLQEHVAEVIGATPAEVGEWAEAAPAIERLRRLTSEGRTPGVPPRERLANLRDKLASLDLGYFPERVAVIREKLEQAATQTQLGSIEEVEADMLALERDVMAMVVPAAPTPAPLLAGGPPTMGRTITEPAGVPAGQPALSEKAPAEKEPTEPRGSFIRRALRWLASMIASED
jgi:predicted regulator of Ras-like GTPase activity (Roadblock/LC7/MglB family)